MTLFPQETKIYLPGFGGLRSPFGSGSVRNIKVQEERLIPTLASLDQSSTFPLWCYLPNHPPWKGSIIYEVHLKQPVLLFAPNTRVVRGNQPFILSLSLQFFLLFRNKREVERILHVLTLSVCIHLLRRHTSAEQGRNGNLI
jgi:hypothetical protein